MPGITGPKDSCSPPSFPADRGRLAYLDYTPERTSRVAVVRGASKVELVWWGLAAGKEASRTAVELPFGRNRTPPFGSPRLAVVRALEDQLVWEQKNLFWSSMTVDVNDPAAAEPVTRVRLTRAHAVIASPDGGTLAALD